MHPEFSLIAHCLHPENILSASHQVLIGASCGAIGAAVCNPLDLIKARLAVEPTYEEGGAELRAGAPPAGSRAQADLSHLGSIKQG